jgi:hypothetical protein
MYSNLVIDSKDKFMWPDPRVGLARVLVVTIEDIGHRHDIPEQRAHFSQCFFLRSEILKHFVDLENRCLNDELPISGRRLLGNVLDQSLKVLTALSPAILSKGRILVFETRGRDQVLREEALLGPEIVAIDWEAKAGERHESRQGWGILVVGVLEVGIAWYNCPIRIHPVCCARVTVNVSRQVLGFRQNLNRDISTSNSCNLP